MRAAVHPATLLVEDRWRPTGTPGPRLRTATRALEHRAGATDVLAIALRCLARARRHGGAHELVQIRYGHSFSGASNKAAHSKKAPRLLTQYGMHQCLLCTKARLTLVFRF